jgi:hypothetical protein
LSVSIIETCALGNAAPLESITFPLTSATATACGNAGAARKTIDTKQSAIFVMEDLHLYVSQCEILFRKPRLARRYTEERNSSTSERP